MHAMHHQLQQPDLSCLQPPTCTPPVVQVLLVLSMHSVAPRCQQRSLNLSTAQQQLGLLFVLGTPPCRALHASQGSS